MSSRSVYLTKYRFAINQRHHFAIFIPNAADDNKDLTRIFKSTPCRGTIINVVGEPVMMGYTLEIKRNYECSTSPDLQEMVPLGFDDPINLYNPPNTLLAKEDLPRATLEHEAARVPPPSKGQNIRALIDGVTTKRCQEWTMEYLTRLVQRSLINPKAVEIAERQRDPPNLGIFGQGRVERRNAPSVAAFPSSSASASIADAST